MIKKITKITLILLVLLILFILLIFIMIPIKENYVTNQEWSNLSTNMNSLFTKGFTDINQFQNMSQSNIDTIKTIFN
jgi:hypothetical protein